MRVRESNQMKVLQGDGGYVNASCIKGNDGTFPLADWNAHVGRYKRTVDVVTPQYHKRRRQGEIIINPFSTFERTVSTSVTGIVLSSTCKSPTPPYVLTLNGPILMHWLGDYPRTRDLFSGAEVDKAVEIASTRCWADVNQAEAQLLVSLLEVKRTLSMLMRPLGNTLSFLAKVKKAKDAAGFSSLTLAQYIAREWLTYRYGWSQLYRDVTSVLKAVGRKEKKGLTVARGTYTLERNQIVNSQAMPAGPGTEIYHLETTYTHKVFVKCGLFYDSELDVERYLGLSRYNVLETAWEVIPFSFVVDWVVNVQSYVNALLPAAGVPVKGSYTTITHIKSAQRSCTSIDVTPRNIPPNIIWSVVQHPAGVDANVERSKDRRYGIKPPSLNVDIRIKDFLDVRVRDALALIVSRLGKS